MNNLTQNLWNNNLKFPTKRIAIIGGGISGLISAAILKKEGFLPKIFERNESYGGVWEIGYSNLKLQSPSNLYQIPFFKPSHELSEYPSSVEVRTYIGEFVTKHELSDLIHCEHEVLSISKGATRSITYRHNQLIHVEEFDFVIISTGVFSDPKIPKIKGYEDFKGTITHTSKFYSTDGVKDKNVVVVGLGKSSLDCLNSVKSKAKAVNFLYRTLYWPIPEYIEICGRKLRPDQFLSNRFMIAIKNGNLPRENEPLEKFAHNSLLGKKLVEKIYQKYEEKIDKVYKLSELGMKPQKRIQNDVYSTFIGPLDVYKAFYDKSISYFQEEISHLTADTLVTSSGREIPCDYLVFGTGFSPKLNFLDSDDLNKLYQYDKDAIYLHRSVINPDLPNTAFIGFMPTLCNPLTSALTVLWLINVFKGEIKLDNREINNQLTCQARVNADFHEKNKIRIKGNLIKDLNLYDSLVSDMNENPKRKGNGFIAEYFSTYTPKDYADLFSRYE